MGGTMQCGNCREALPDDAAFCLKCGAPQLPRGDPMSGADMAAGVRTSDPPAETSPFPAASANNSASVASLRIKVDHAPRTAADRTRPGTWPPTPSPTFPAIG